VQLLKDRISGSSPFERLAVGVVCGDEGINALNERIQGSQVQLEGVRRQIKFIQEEIETKQYLLQTQCTPLI